MFKAVATGPPPTSGPTRRPSLRRVASPLLVKLAYFPRRSSWRCLFLFRPHLPSSTPGGFSRRRWRGEQRSSGAGLRAASAGSTTHSGSPSRRVRGRRRLGRMAGRQSGSERVNQSATCQSLLSSSPQVHYLGLPPLNGSSLPTTAGPFLQIRVTTTTMTTERERHPRPQSCATTTTTLAAFQLRGRRSSLAGVPLRLVLPTCAQGKVGRLCLPRQEASLHNSPLPYRSSCSTPSRRLSNSVRATR